jgi:large subunit ribosomal protein L10
MPMTKDQKTVAVEEISEKLNGVSTLYLTNHSGLTVAQVNDLRNRFRTAGIEYRVLKNTLVRLAMERKGGYDELFEHLNGPTAVAFSHEPAAPARVMKKFLQEKNLQKPEFKAAYVDGAVFAGESLDALAALRSKDELVGDIIGLLLSPIQNVVGALQAQGQNIVGILKTLSEREA